MKGEWEPARAGVQGKGRREVHVKLAPPLCATICSVCYSASRVQKVAQLLHLALKPQDACRRSRAQGRGEAGEGREQRQSAACGLLRGMEAALNSRLAAKQEAAGEQRVLHMLSLRGPAAAGDWVLTAPPSVSPPPLHRPAPPPPGVALTKSA